LRTGWVEDRREWDPLSHKERQIGRSPARKVGGNQGLNKKVLYKKTRKGRDRPEGRGEEIWKMKKERERGRNEREGGGGW